MLVVTSVLAQVDARLPPLSYSVWLVDFQVAQGQGKRSKTQHHHHL